MHQVTVHTLPAWHACTMQSTTHNAATTPTHNATTTSTAATTTNPATTPGACHSVYTQRSHYTHRMPKSFYNQCSTCTIHPLHKRNNQCNHDCSHTAMQVLNQYMRMPRGQHCLAP